MSNVLSTTLAALRQGFMEYIDEQWYNGTTTAGGTATTIIDTTNRIEKDNKFQYWWALLTSGTYSGQVRQVSSSTQSSGTVTVGVAFGGAPGSSVTYEVLPYHPTNHIRVALNQGLLRVWPNLGRQIHDYGLITGNWLPGSPQDWQSTTSLRYVTLTGASATLGQETTLIRRLGTKSAKLTRVGTDCYLNTSDTEWKGLLDLGGQSIYFESWCYATVASRARLNILVNGASVATSSYHTGGSTYELLQAGPVTITDSPTSISFRREVNTGNTAAYFDEWRVIGPRINRYVAPLTFSLSQPAAVSLQTYGTPHGTIERPCDDLEESRGFAPLNFKTFYDDRLGAQIVELYQYPTSGYSLRLDGTEYVTTVSAETDTVPFNPPQTYLVYAATAEALFRKIGNAEKVAFWRDEYRRLVAVHGQPLPVTSQKYSWSPW